MTFKKMRASKTGDNIVSKDMSEAIQELKQVGLTNILPIKEWLEDKFWNLIWVRWFCFFSLFPLFMVYYTADSEIGIEDVAFAFGIYFAIFWGIMIYIIIRPDRFSKMDIIQIGAFTSIIGIFIVLVVENLPIISSYGSGFF